MVQGFSHVSPLHSRGSLMILMAAACTRIEFGGRLLQALALREWKSSSTIGP